jgi:polyisoprenyl-teichoic acid--peptidoglycan teichoic acid transferase
MDLNSRFLRLRAEAKTMGMMHQYFRNSLIVALLLMLAVPALVLAQAPRPAPDLTTTENILILGMDQRPGDTAWRTDTIMVAAIDHETDRIGIVSIPRDLWVNIPGFGPGRINQVDMQGELQKKGGGPALVSRVIQDTLGIKTRHWVRIKQDGLPVLVDTLGGVTVTLDCPLHEITPHATRPGQFERFDLPAGQVFLDGKDAKKFATFRYATSDLSRSARQMQLIWAIRNRALQVNAIPKIPELYRTLRGMFGTDLSVLDFVRLARLGASLDASDIHGLQFSAKAIAPATVGKAQVIKVVSKEQLHKEFATLFAATSIADQGRDGSGGCPTPAAPLSTPTPAPVP